MKKVFLFTFLILSFGTQAMTSIEMEGKKLVCDRLSGETFHCQKDNERVLVVKNFMGYVAVAKTGEDLPKMKMISKVEEDGKMLYETPVYPGLRMGAINGRESGIGLNNTALIKAPESKASLLTSSNAIVYNYGSIDDPWAREFVAASKEFVKQESTSKPEVRIQIADEGSYNCKMGVTRKLTADEESAAMLSPSRFQCNFYACTSSMGGEKILGYIPPPLTMASPHLLKLKGNQTSLHIDGFKVLGKEGTDSLPIYDIPAMPAGIEYMGLNDSIDQKLFTPGIFQKNQTAFNYLTNSMTEQTMGTEANYCTGDNDVTKLLNERNKIAEDMKSEVAKLELAHYLTLTEGRIISVVVDAAKAKDLGCRYDGMILSAGAAQHLEYLQKVHARPAKKYLSVTEVQKLFTKAKNMSDIPFGYKYDGCYARAHVMARRFEEMDIQVEKAWIKGSLFVPGTDIQWNYHVAPVVNVKEENGQIKKYVIDPSLNDKAVLLDEWVASMGQNVKGPVMKTAYPFPENIASFQRTAVAISSSDIYVPDNNEERTEEVNMNSAIQTMSEYKAALEEKAGEL